MKSHEVRVSQVCAGAGRPGGRAALFALAAVELCSDAFRLNFQVWETESVLSPLRVSHFPLRHNLRATVLTGRSSFQWALCSRQEGQALLNVMIWNDPSQGWKTKLIQLRPGVLGFEPATVSIL